MDDHEQLMAAYERLRTEEKDIVVNQYRTASNIVDGWASPSGRGVRSPARYGEDWRAVCGMYNHMHTRFHGSKGTDRIAGDTRTPELWAKVKAAAFEYIDLYFDRKIEWLNTPAGIARARL